MFVVIEIVGLILWVGVMFMALKEFSNERFWFWLCQVWLISSVVDWLRLLTGTAL